MAKHPAREIDQNYFLHLKRLVQLEEAEEAEQVRLELTELTPEERQHRGKALLGLVIQEEHYSPAGHFLITFQRENEGDLPLFSLDIGDVVLIVSRGEEFLGSPPATIYEKTKNSITVALNKELPEAFTGGRYFDLHKSVNQVTYRRMMEALEGVLAAKDTRLAHFRDISLKLRKPVSEDYEVREKDFFDQGLNPAQKEAVTKGLMAKDVALIHGPPGTGKTTVLVEIIRQAVRMEKSVFVTAPSNVACDNLLERLVAKGLDAVRLGHPARITTELREHTLDFKLGLHPLNEVAREIQLELDRLSKRNQGYREKRYPGFEKARQTREEITELRRQKRELREEIFRRVLAEAEVFVGTPVSMMDRAIREKDFDFLIFDEATQATEPTSWIPLSGAKKVVMAGDHFQLPPTVRSKEAEAKGLGVTLFERFYEVLGDDYKHLINRQYRMNAKIMGFSSRLFYKNLLVADESVAQGTLSDLKGVKKCAESEEPIIFLDTAGKGFEEKLEEGSQSRYNPEEANLVLEVLRRMIDLGVPPGEIAVISPYSAQVRLLTSQSPDPAVEIGSVDGFQGREKELVIVSLVRSNTEGEMGFLTDTRRMNVAITRAKKKLIAVGNSATLSTIAFYRDFLKYVEEAGGLRSAWEL